MHTDESASSASIDNDELAPPTAPALDRRERLYRFPLERLENIAISGGPEWLIKGLMPAHGLQVLYGVSGTGKSFSALDVALHVAAGRPWMGRKVRQAGVVYVAAEAGDGMRKRIVAAVEHKEFPRSLPFALVAAAPDLGHREGDADRLAAEIAAQVPNDFDLGLVIVDTLARTMAGCDESGSAGMGLFIENAERLGRRLGATVLVVHHAGKDLERGMRGSSALLGAADAVWRVVSADDEKGTPAHILVEKMKEDEGQIALPFALRRVAIGLDADGEPRTTCVVERVEDSDPRSPAPPIAPAEARTVSGHDLTSGEAAFVANLKTEIEARGELRPRFRHIPAGQRVLEQAKLAEVEAFRIQATSPKSRKSRIDQLIRSLVAKGRLRRHGGFVWLVAEPC